MRADSLSPRELFPLGVFGSPATSKQIESVEMELGIQLPTQLREMYLDFDGFREDIGNAKYLLSLVDEDGIGSLVTTTKFCWNELPQYQAALNFRSFVFFGYSGRDDIWGIDWQTETRIVCYHHQMEAECEVAESKILDVWLKDYACYSADA